MSTGGIDLHRALPACVCEMTLWSCAASSKSDRADRGSQGQPETQQRLREMEKHV